VPEAGSRYETARPQCDVTPLRLLAELGTRPWFRKGCCGALATAVLLACGGAAHAHYNTQIYTFTSDHCISGNCGSNPWGTVTVSQDPSSHQEIDFTVSLNSPYEFFSSGNNSTEPLFAVDINVANVGFSNFKLNNATTTNVAQGGASGNLAQFGSFPYTLTATPATGTALSGVLAFTASVTSGTLTPDNIVFNNHAYMTAAIALLTNNVVAGNGNVASVNLPTPEPAALGLFAVALAGLGVVRSRRLRR
jgi:hypothetical protein